MDNFSDLNDGKACREQIESEEYVDLLIRSRDMEWIKERYGDMCYQYVDAGWISLYADTGGIPPLDFGTYGYYSIPKLYGIMEQTGLIDTGIVRVRNNENLGYTGKNVIMGFVDTGIDYLHPVFKDSVGRTRIISIWDQTDTSGNTPKGFDYGSEYGENVINLALESDNPLSIVPEQDIVSGHGTFMAGIAAGSIMGTDFSGAAPDSMIAMVKLRPAKQALRDFYFINEEAIAYSETDIMLGIRYLTELARREEKNLVICMGIGTASGPHASGTPLTQYVNDVCQQVGVAIVWAAGNEGNSRHHFLGNNPGTNEYQTVEVRVGENEKGFLMELWGERPDVFSVEIVSPSGEVVNRIQIESRVSRRVEFVFERTIIYVNYELIETINGNQLIAMRFENPSAGIWRIRVYDESTYEGFFNMWLPISDFLSSDTYFVNSSPYITILQPSTSYYPITTGAYDHGNNSIWIDSGRGFSANGVIKPNLAAPGVNVYGPRAGGSHSEYTIKSGTSIAAAYVAGASALLFEWRNMEERESVFNTQDIKSLLTLGTKRDRNITYPNPEWGYGKLDVYGIFERLRGN